MKPLLFIFSGLPASGKSTLAKLITKEYHAAYLRIDTIEQGIRDLCDFNVQGEGYRLSYRIAADNLKLNQNVIADSCNPFTLTRNEWQQVAEDNNGIFINIQVICSDKLEHKKRVETRKNEVQGLKLPTWEDVENREYHAWETDRIIIDTASKSIEESFEELNDKIKQYVKTLSVEESKFEVNIREAELQDAEALTVLKQQVWISTYATEGISEEFSKYVLYEFTLEKTIQSLTDFKKKTFVALLGNNPVGCVEISITPAKPTLSSKEEAIEITVLYVLERFSGKEIGQKLLDKSLDFIKGLNHNKVFLTVYHKNFRAIHFYHKNRFVQIGEMDFILDKNNSYKNLVMQKEIK